MSIVACTDCGCYIDSDKHPECFDMSGRPYCRDCPPGHGNGKDYTKQVEAMLNNPPAEDDDG